MKNVAVVSLLIGLVSSTALGGMVGFDPSDTMIDRNVAPPGVFTVDVSIDATSLDTYNSVDVVFGSDDGLTIMDFTFNTPGVTRFFETLIPDSTYASAIKIGYFGSNTDTPSSQLLGTLTVDATGLADGVYNIVVNAETDGGASKLTFSTDVDLLFGGATVNITPEPMTLSLLGLGALALLRRRRTA